VAYKSNDDSNRAAAEQGFSCPKIHQRIPSIFKKPVGRISPIRHVQIDSVFDREAHNL
jgi:hypothetical protein